MASRYFPLYNVDAAVGRGKPNKPEDVRLVQAIFTELSRIDSLQDWLSGIPPQAGNMKVTGTFDDTLEQWILAMQRFYSKTMGAFVKIDGVIDPMPQVSGVDVSIHFKSGRLSTIALMCNRLWRLNQSAYMRIGDQQRIPWLPDPNSWFGQ